MKTISGKVTATRAISLSKAAKFLSDFVSAESEASNAISNYLRRTSSAFNELTQLHQKLRSDPDRKKHRSVKPQFESDLGAKKEGESFEEKPSNLDLGREKKRTKTESGGESGNFSGVIEKGDGDSVGVETPKKTKKKKSGEGRVVVGKRDEIEVKIMKDVKYEIEEKIGINEAMEKKRKKKGEEGKSDEVSEKRVEIEKSGKKKRKMTEAEGVGNDDSEPRSAKKKQRKLE